ncbi:MAG: SWIB/MDM2 domain-containing proteins, partial [uncultured Acetobacteraceae bacterium]
AAAPAGAATVGGAGRGGRRSGAPAPGRGGEQGLGLHQGEQPAEPGGPPRDPGRRQAPL